MWQHDRVDPSLCPARDAFAGEADDIVHRGQSARCIIRGE
jgi:hypothetical protein